MWQWERPWLFALGLIIFILIPVLRHFSGGRYIAAALNPPGGIGPVTPFSVRVQLTAAALLRFVAGVALTIALAGPLTTVSHVVWTERGADILFVLDASPSMAAKDARMLSFGIDQADSAKAAPRKDPEGEAPAPELSTLSDQAYTSPVSRFDASRRFIQAYTQARGADAIGLIGVGQEAALLVPPTIDRKSFAQRLETINIGEFGDGTAIGSALAIAAYHLRLSSADRRIVVLISDGENNAGAIHPETAARGLKAIGVDLYIIGVGKLGEAPIDYIDPESGLRRTGSFLSRFDEAGLRKTAEAANGQYYDASSSESLAAAFHRLAADNPIHSRGRKETETLPRHRFFLLIAFIALSLDQLLRRFSLGAFL